MSTPTSTLALSFTPSDHEPGNITLLELTDEQVTAGLHHDVGPKAGSAFLACVLDPPYRSNANARRMTALCLDLDHLEEGALELLVEALRAKSVKHWWFHSFSYPNARLLIPFATPFPVSSPEAWSKVAWPALVAHLGLEKTARADVSCRDCARLFYEPRRPAEDSPHRSGFSPGEPLDWRPVLAALPATPVAPRAPRPATAPMPAVEDPSLPVDLQAVRAKLLRKAPDTFAHRLGKGLALTPPPHLRSPGQPARHLAWWHAMGALSFAAEAWMATAALLEICRPSWHAEVAESPDDYTPWEKVEGLLEQQRASAPAKKAEFQAKRDAQQSDRDFVRGVRLSAPKEPEDEGAPVAPLPTQGLEGPALAAVLTWVETKADENDKLLKTIGNLSVILRDSFYWKGRIKKNLLSGMVECYGGPCFEPSAKPFEVTDIHVARIRQWLFETFNVEYELTAVNTYVDLAADDNAYDPVVDYLRALKWDGQGRLDGMLEGYFKAEVTPDNAPYVRAVGAKWMISAVARALEPGCQADVMLVLQGKQGIRKSSAIRVLGGAWAADFDYDIGSNESLTACSENWIMEMGEMSSLGKADRDRVKQFLTKRWDKFRAPYARRQENHPRRCVLIGSSNEDDLFSDETGNRRFWPVSCGGLIDTDGLAQDRDNLWAEAVVRYDAGEAWHLSAEVEAIAHRETETRMAEDSFMDTIADWLLLQSPADRPSEVRTVDVAESALDLGRAPERKEQMRIAAALKRLGFVKQRRKRVKGVLSYCWTVPEDFRTAPQASRTKGPTAALPPEASA